MATVRIFPKASQVSGTHSDMPLVLIPSALPDIGTLTLTEAQSIRIYTDSLLTTEVAREVVSADEIHFKAPSVSSSMEFWVDWDGVRSDYAATDTYGRNAVWSAFTLVHHMSDTTNATGNTNFNLTNRNSITFNSGKLGNAADSGSGNTNKSLTSGTTEALNLTEVQSNWSTSFWINPASVSAFFTVVRQYADDGASKKMFQIAYEPSGSNGLDFYWVGSALNHYYSGDTLSTSTWYKVRYSLGTSGALNMYLNGTNILSTTVTNFNSRADNVGVNSAWMYFGDSNDTFTSLFNPFSGKIDEGRLIKSNIGADWETTEYNNQNDNFSFWDTEVIGGAPSSSGFFAIL